MNSKDTKIIQEYISKHIPHIVFIIGASILLGFFRMYGTTYIEYLTDAIELGKTEILAKLILIACACQAMFYFLRWVVAVTAARFDEQVALDIRVRLLDHVNHIAFVDYEKLNTGNIQSIIRTDSQKAAKAMYIIFSRILPNVFILLFSYLYMFTIDVNGTLFIIAVSILLGVLNYHINKKIKEYEFKSRKASGLISDIVVKVCEIFDTIKVYQASEYILNQYNRRRDEFNQAALKSTAIRAGNDVVLSLVNNVTLFTISILLAFKAIDGHSSVGEVLAYIGLLTQVSVCVNTILNWMSSLANAKASMERINNLFNIQVPNEPYDSESYDVNHVKINHINYSYENKTEVLKDLNLDFKKGNVYQIIGESGSGKTTLIKLLLGFYKCTGMDIRINGNKKINSLQSLIGYVPANPNLLNASLFDNIALGNEKITAEQCYRVAKAIGIEEWIHSLPKGLEYVVERNAANLSGGQKQAIAILRVLVSNYPIIIMDEPFSALDKQKESNLITIIDKIKQDRIILFTSHRESKAENEVITINL